LRGIVTRVTEENALPIEVIMMKQDEAERALAVPAASRFRDFEVAFEAWLPEIVLTSALERFRAGELWFWCAPRFFLLSSEHRIIGSGCYKNSPRDGAVEIGCGVAEGYHGRNYATRGVELLIAEGFTKPEVAAIAAETAVWNIASQRVLEKASFIRTGSRVDPDDGPVILWRRERLVGQGSR
jgi:RimJ/RimL family protein N-acetyltransferase